MQTYKLPDLPKTKGVIRENKNLANITWFKTGGAADFFFIPQDIEDLQHFLSNMPHDLNVFVLGVGSNLLIRDAGFRGVVIRLGAGFNYINKLDVVTLQVGGAVLDLNIASYAVEESIAGLEFFSGIPGTIGGAVAMNAGAYGKETKDVFLSAEVIDLSGNKKSVSREDFKFVYRGNNLGYPFIVSNVTLRGCEGIKEQIRDRFWDVQQKRAATQPIKEKTGGSTFANPVGYKAWELIDRAGCRGMVIGGAKVSEMHCNFFINENNATASDLENLILEVQKRVFQASGVLLEPEIKIIGDKA